MAHSLGSYFVYLHFPNLIYIFSIFISISNWLKLYVTEWTTFVVFKGPGGGGGQGGGSGGGGDFDDLYLDACVEGLEKDQF